MSGLMTSVVLKDCMQFSAATDSAVIADKDDNSIVAMIQFLCSFRPGLVII